METTDVYRHSAECRSFREEHAGCICLAPRFRRVFIVAISFAAIEWLVGHLIGSGAVRGDAWHIASDSVTDLAAWFLAVGFARSAFPRLWHRYGTVAQAGLLSTAGAFILVETFIVGHDDELSGELLVVIGLVAVAVNYWRFRIAHPGGGIAPLLHDIVRVLRKRAAVTPFFIGEALHIISDIGASVLVVVGGCLMVIGFGANIDQWIGGTMACLVFASAAATLLLAREEHHH